MSLVAVAVLTLSACSDDEGSDTVSASCDLLTEQDAATLLDVDVVRAAPPDDVLKRLARERGDALSEGERAGLEAAFSQACSYAPEGEVGFTLAAIQVDRALFRSSEEFKGAWPDEAEILPDPGLAAALVQDPTGGASLHVLLNDQGDSLALVVTGSPVDRASLLAVGEDVVSRY